MAKQKVTMYDLAPLGCSIEGETQINGRNVTRGTELSVRGIPGRVLFIRKVTNDETGATWIDALEPEPHKMIRSFKEDRVKRVHRIDKTRENQEKTA
jgi:hypothetical protein